MDLSEAAVYRILDGLTTLALMAISFAVCYFGCKWLFPTVSRAVIGAVAGATAVATGVRVFIVLKDQGDAD